MSFFVLSQPDYTVGFEISSNQLALADFTAGQELSQLTLTLPQRHDILSYCELRNVRIISVRSALLNTAEPATKIFAPAAINEAAFCGPTPPSISIDAELFVRSISSAKRFTLAVT